ncbi:MAG: carbohydrate ABC transporter, N-acetylglucosamine/diacetylchitobiose-binding protein [Devosia sp. 67-54]|uniref:N-acetylglucosamine/diacetylchitobiose ABC transporter substrate-binding protein n=1 Tax=unclassified Devosia TaxID=196773 RepID=UPI0009592716|nr:MULTISPECIES: N-acetylglucosamine/diacetylchitobiose ABC transporter substrate-binding protein [unclassified Devosia]MBN9306584.1 N-acetylglucosamine/diacetylchitobiose ABC transporter substrate-binding protein [Devosia sp.]OJX15866.1 MAG: carbohydrate ABC transporter, N-acetylglucosamine/diacetylchitobiose-binding protein [Devosia sp. 67-54]
MGINKTIDRRSFMRGTAAAAAALPLGGLLGSTGLSTGAFAQDAANPFGVADGSAVDAVIFNGGYGIDYVQFAADVMQKAHPKVKVTVSPSTQIATELQPRFVGGNPPDIIDNSGADAIGFNAILDQLEDMNSVLDAPNLEGTKIRDTLFGGVEAPGTFGDKFVALNYVMTVYGIWYSQSLFDENGWKAPTNWDEAKELGAKAKEKGKYLLGWGKEAATYYQTTMIASAIKEGGDEVRLALDNIQPKCWSHPAVQAAFQHLYDIIQAGYMHPGGSGTQFTAAQAQWSNDQAWLLYPSGSWIENEMKKATKDGFKMTGMPDLAVTAGSKMKPTALHATAGEPFIIPTGGANVAGGKELLRTMLSKEAATNFCKTRLAPTIVKGLVPEDGFGSTALVSQNKMLADGGSDIFSWNFVDLYGTNKDMLVPWNSFLDGKLDVAGLTSALQGITDAVYNDSSVNKVVVK